MLARSGVVYAADPEADWADPATWKKANPSLPHLPALLKVYEREAAEADSDPSLLPVFRALRCNMGAVDHEVSVLLEAADWQRAEVDILPAAAGAAVWGVDLSGGDAAMGAGVAAYWAVHGPRRGSRSVPGAAVPCGSIPHRCGRLRDHERRRRSTRHGGAGWSAWPT